MQSVVVVPVSCKIASVRLKEFYSLRWVARCEQQSKVWTEGGVGLSTCYAYCTTMKRLGDGIVKQSTEVGLIGNRSSRQMVVVHLEQ